MTPHAAPSHSEWVSRRLMLLPLLLACAACVATSAPVGADAPGYLPAIAKATGLLEKGRWSEAAQAFRQARDLDLNDPLAEAGLGYALDSDGQTAAARGELDVAIQLNGKCRTALWASALCSLNEGQLDDARTRVQLLAGMPGEESPDSWICLAYVRCAAGDMPGATEALKHAGSTEALSPPQRSVAGLVAGAVAFAAGQYPRAADSLRLAARSLPPVSFLDRVHTRRAPILPEARTSHVEPAALVSDGGTTKARALTGTVRLSCNPYRIPNSRFASFYIDGKCIGTTNVAPLRFDWNTRTVRNGFHKIVIRGAGESGDVLGQTEEVVLVENEGGVATSSYPDEEYARAEKALRHAMVLQPDVLATHYLLGLSLARSGDAQGAAASLEIVVGFDPDYGKARRELQAICTARSAGRIRKVSAVPTTQRKIALTFDDGPNPLYTPPLLDTLERYHAHCTMFLVGAQAEAYPDIVHEMVEKGHEIADHTYSHPNLKTLDRRSIEMELMRCRAVLRRLTGRNLDLFRPPGGNTDTAVSDMCAAYGFTTVYWSVFDSWLQKFDESTVLTRLVAQMKPGSIVLLHNGNNKTARIVEPLLEELVREGYEMVTVSELLASRTPGAPVPADAQEAPELRDDQPTGPTRAPGKGASHRPAAKPGAHRTPVLPGPRRG